MALAALAAAGVEEMVREAAEFAMAHGAARGQQSSRKVDEIVREVMGK
jgi:hypothetical protein